MVQLGLALIGFGALAGSVTGAAFGWVRSSCWCCWDVENEEPAVIVGISGDDVAVSLDTGHGYDGPDVTDDLCRRARELYRLALHDHHEETGPHVCETE